MPDFGVTFLKHLPRGRRCRTCTTVVSDRAHPQGANRWHRRNIARSPQSGAALRPPCGDWRVFGATGIRPDWDASVGTTPTATAGRPPCAATGCLELIQGVLDW